MFEDLINQHEQLAECLRILTDGLVHHCDDELVTINGRTRRVDDIIDELQRHIEQIERTLDAHAAWLEEATFLNDDLRCEISPLLAGLQRYVAREFGAHGPHLRDLGFEPVNKSSGRKRRDRDEEDGEEEVSR